MIFILPLPPGINNTYGIDRRKRHPLFKKKVARNWEDDARWAIIEQKSKMTPRPRIMTCKVKVGITWHIKSNRDIDAGIKVLFDCFQGMLYENDNQIRKIMYVDIVENDPHPRVEFEILPL